MSKKKFFIVFLIIFLFSIINLFPSLHLGLSGDSWLMLRGYHTILQNQNNNWLTNLSLLFSSYGSFYAMMGLVNNLVGYEHIYYYSLAYFLRFLAALSFFPLVFFISRNFYSALFASLFFSVTTIGFDATNWVFNMPVYLMITFLNFFLIFWVKLHKSAEFKNWLLSVISFVLFYLSAPLRAVVVLPFLILMEIYWVIKEKNKPFFIKKIVLSTSIFITFFILSAIVNQGVGSIQWDAPFQSGIQTFQQEISHNRFSFLFYPLVIFGKMLIPINLVSLPKYSSVFDLLFFLILPIFCIFIIIFHLIGSSIYKFNSLGSKVLYSISIFWTLVVIYLYKAGDPFLSRSEYLLFIMVGGYFLILWSFLIFLLRKYSQLVLLLIISILLTFTSFSHAWWRTPLTIFEPTHRYLILSAAGITIFLSAILNIYPKIKSRIFLFIPLFLLFLNMYSTRVYLNQELEGHSAEIAEKIWSQFPYIPEIGKVNPLVFYFAGDDTNNTTIDESITFGFSSHICLIYKLEEQNSPYCRDLDPFIPVRTIPELIAVVKDGSPLVAYGFPFKPLSIDRIYAFRLEGKDKLIDITSQIRQELSNLFPK